MDDYKTNSSSDDNSGSDTRDNAPQEASNVLFVGNLSWNVGDEDLANFFTEKDSDGNVTFEPQKDESGMAMSKVIRDRERDNRSKGFGFVTFVDAETATKAKNAKDGQMLDDREIRIQFKIDRPREDRPRKPFTGGGERRFGNNNTSGGGNNRRFDRSSNNDRGGYNRMND